MDAEELFSLKYYAPEYDRKKHETILQLLNEIKAKHGIDYEVFEFRTKKSEYTGSYYVDDEHEKEIYEKDFKPRKNILKQRVGESIRRALRTRSGGYVVAGTIAIARNGQVEWFATYGDKFKEYDTDYTIGFLKATLARGSALLEELCPEVLRPDVEAKILDEFILSGTLKGQFEREFKLGSRVFVRMIEGEEVKFDYRKSADALCRSPEGTWIIEVKRKLDYEALGEVLTYASLYEDEYGEKARPAIVCRAIEEEILVTCKKQGVRVFEIRNGKIVAHQ